MSDLTSGELNRRASEANERYQESIEYVTPDEISAAARTGDEKIRRLERATPQALSTLWTDIRLLVSIIRGQPNGTGLISDWTCSN